MCKIGDIIVVNEYHGDDGVKLSRHSFVVINDKPDFIEGLKYDFVANVMSSFKSEEHRNKKLKFIENLEIISNDIISENSKNSKRGFIKADQLIYFDKSNIDYYVLGRVSDELLGELMLLLVKLADKNKIINNINNIGEPIKS